MSLPPEAAESHTHLAHAVIRYLGLTAPEELVPFGINDAAGIVDLISQVRPTFGLTCSVLRTNLRETTFCLLSLRRIPSLSPQRRWLPWVSASLRWLRWSTTRATRTLSSCSRDPPGTRRAKNRTYNSSRYVIFPLGKRSVCRILSFSPYYFMTTQVDLHLVHRHYSASGTEAG